MNDVLGDFPVLNWRYIEAMHADFVHDPETVPTEWRSFFERHGQTLAAPAPSTLSQRQLLGDGAEDGRDMAALQDRVDQLVRAYRVRGHMVAQVDPLKRPRPHQPELDPEHYGFDEADLEKRFSTRTIAGGQLRKLREIITTLRNTYCRSIGVQFMHIDDLDKRHWLQDRMEGCENRIDLDADVQVRLMTLLTRALVLEDFIQKKYIGAKSFSLEGSESLIPLLDRAIERAAEHGVDEIVIGMAHRGRLNVLANIMQKSPHELFSEFEDAEPEQHLGSGDVKYHLGYSTDWKTQAGKIVHLSLCFNPSHLEFINPVAVGRLRAKQDRANDQTHEKGMALLIHGDASFAGEGIVQETLNLSELAGYTVGGTIHVIVNNQIGFTTPPEEGRSSIYASGVAKMLQIPIFHVNGEDPEAVTQVTRLALDFRNEFKRDVVIDMYGFRRRGHNEMDDPSFTQPLLAKAIKDRPSLRDGYLKRLQELGRFSEEDADEIASSERAKLEEALSIVRQRGFQPDDGEFRGIWQGYKGGPDADVAEVETAVNRERLSSMLAAQTRFPEGFNRHPRLKRGMEARLAMAEAGHPLDWAAAESLAFASLAADGVRIRLSGQDTARGTFSQRHAVLHDNETGEVYVPLQHVAPDQAPVEILNSPLSEAGVLGFEYGYSLDCPDGLILWEAQFGDFVNAAQVMIDQFIVSAECKWNRLSGLVLLLPHGFEGTGPEHSSARLERFLTLAAEDNIQVVYPSTPAQYFHCLRRQALRKWRKPLVMMTPKSLVRDRRVVSELGELADGTFRRVIADGRANADGVTRILLCSGKIYFDIEERREAQSRDDLAIVRVEQLYPLADSALESALAGYDKNTPAVWVQEEPDNMGAWRYWRTRFPGKLLGRFPFSCISRPEAASPATGSKSRHTREQDRLLAAAFGDL